MTACVLLLASLVVLPGLVVCNYPWPDNVTQYKGYIQVSDSVSVRTFSRLNSAKRCGGGASSLRIPCACTCVYNLCA